MDVINDLGEMLFDLKKIRRFRPDLNRSTDTLSSNLMLDLSIREIANGFIVVCEDEERFFEGPTSVLEWMSEKLA